MTVAKLRSSLLTLTLGGFATTTLLLGCSASAGLSTPEEIPAVAIVAVDPTPACPAATGTAVLTLSDVGTQVTEAAPGQTPAQRVDVVGTASGLAGETVYLVLLSFTQNCPVRVSEATVEADGSFTASIDIGNLVDMHVVAIATTGAAADIGCTPEDDCLTVTSGAPSAVSNALQIRLRF